MRAVAIRTIKTRTIVISPESWIIVTVAAPEPGIVIATDTENKMIMIAMVVMAITVLVVTAIIIAATIPAITTTVSFSQCEVVERYG